MDLDETLVHSSVKPSTTFDFQVEIFLENGLCMFYVYKRPHVDFFLREVRRPDRSVA